MTRWSSLLLCGSFLLGAAVVPALANTINDPDMFIDAGDPPPPIPITIGINDVLPNNTQTDTFDFINNTNGIISGFLFETTVAKNFTGPLSCASGYFLHCTVNYTPSTGDLIFDFFGIARLDGDEVASKDSERGEHEGIPLDGVFHITLVGFDTGTGLYNSPSDITAFKGSYTTVPEPSTVLFLGLGLLAIVVQRYRRQRQLAPATSTH